MTLRPSLIAVFAWSCSGSTPPPAGATAPGPTPDPTATAKASLIPADILRPEASRALETLSLQNWQEKRNAVDKQIVTGSDRFERGVRGRTAANPAVSADGGHIVFDELRTAAKDCPHVLSLLTLATKHVSEIRLPRYMNLCPTVTSLSVARDASKVAFCSGSFGLTPNDKNQVDDVFVWDRARNRLELLSVSAKGQGANGNSCSSKISDDGRFVAFQSDADDLVPDDKNGVSDVFVRDLVTGKTELVSVGYDRSQGDQPSEISDISPDGRFVAFASQAGNLVYGDKNGAFDVFLRDRTRRTTERVSLTSLGAEVNGPSHAASLSADGRYVSFVSDGDNLVKGIAPGVSPVYVRDRTGRKTSAFGSAARPGDSRTRAQLSGDGQTLVYTSRNNRSQVHDAAVVALDLKSQSFEIVGQDGSDGGRLPQQRMSRDAGVHAIQLLSHLVVASAVPEE